MSDFSPEYIKICELAKEIQESWKPQYGDWVQHEDEGDGKRIVIVEAYMSEEGLWFAGRKVGWKSDCIWLPSQEQLQGMVLDEWGYGIEVLNRYYVLYDEFHSWIKEEAVSNFENSGVQLWLAFAMQKLHNKKWTGEGWEAIE